MKEDQRMNIKWTRTAAVVALGLTAVIGGVGCEKQSGDGPAERAGQAIDETMRKVDDKLKDVGNDAKDVVKDAAEDAKEAVKDVTDDVKESVKN